ncbi:MAG: hypothetical protein ABL931_19370, partial [Usitatibacteraceae bacterium]
MFQPSARTSALVLLKPNERPPFGSVTWSCCAVENSRICGNVEAADTISARSCGLATLPGAKPVGSTNFALLKPSNCA